MVAKDVGELHCVIWISSDSSNYKPTLSTFIYFDHTSKYYWNEQHFISNQQHSLSVPCPSLCWNRVNHLSSWYGAVV